MPSKSKAQQRLMGMALAAKRGKGHFNGKIQEVADSMSEKQLHDFAVTKHKDIPEKKAEILSLMRAKLAAEGLGNTIGELVFGHNYIPRPSNGEGIYDAMLQRDRNIAARGLQSEALANNPFIANLGLKDNPLIRAVGYFAGNSAPVKHLQEGLHGANTMGAFGRIGPASNGEITNTMKNLAKNFYKRANEKLIGGEGDNKPDNLFPKKELFKGIKHESEHTNNKSIAKEIAKDHLSEQNDYYTALNKAKLGYSKI
jgi:hypothetical protein